MFRPISNVVSWRTRWCHLTLESLEDRSLPSALAVPSVSAAALSATEIKVSWHAVKGATSYQVEESINGDWVQLAGLKGSARSFKLNSLSDGTSYTFEVTAANASTTSTSPPVSAETFPAAPVVTATAISQSEIDLSWGEVASATGYEVKEKAGGKWKSLATLGAGSTSYAATGLSVGKTYALEVLAQDMGGSTAGLAPPTTTFPGTAVVFAALLTPTELKLSWQAVHGATSYQVSEQVSGSWQTVGTTKSRSITLTGLTTDSSYTFEVTSINAGNSSTTQPLTFSTQTVPQNRDPAAGAGYSPVGGTLFGPGGYPSDLDVAQGDLGDCWLISGLAAIAAQDPQAIASMFRYDGATKSGIGLYTVRLYSGPNTPTYVTISVELPAGGNFYDQPLDGQLWVALAEKAFAVVDGDSYNNLNGGDPSEVFEAVLGTPAYDTAPGTTQLATAWQAGEPVCICTFDPSSPLIVPDHAYAVIGYNAATGNFTVLNPWGVSEAAYAGVYGMFAASASFIQANFDEAALGGTGSSGFSSGSFASKPVARPAAAIGAYTSAGSVTPGSLQTIVAPPTPPADPLALFEATSADLKAHQHGVGVDVG